MSLLPSICVVLSVCKFAVKYLHVVMLSNFEFFFFNISVGICYGRKLN